MFECFDLRTMTRLLLTLTVVFTNIAAFSADSLPRLNVIATKINRHRNFHRGRHLRWAIDIS